MAQNLIIANATYNNVPAVDISKVGGGTARFVDAAEYSTVYTKTIGITSVSGYSPIGGTASNKMELRRSGNVVQCTIFLVGAFTTVNSWLTFVAAGNSNMNGFKPVFEAINSAGNYQDAYYSSSYGLMRASIASTGQIKITCSSSSTLEHIVTITYITNDAFPT